MPDPQLVCFGVFELDLRTRELRKKGIRLRLQSQPLQVLEALLERPGELVTREELQRRIWGGDTFVDFDQSLNRAVNKVRDALGDGAENPRFIETLTRRGYRFIAPVNGGASTAAPTSSARRAYRRYVWAAGALLLAAGAGLGLGLHRASPAPRVVPLTTFSGDEVQPAFSPDGRQVAFAWNGEKQDNYDIYVKVVGEPGVLRLTSDPALDGFPAWSPDGRQIAFASERGEGGIYLVSPLGGSERLVATLQTRSRPCWSPDGKFLIVAKRFNEDKPEPGPGDGALFLIPLAGEGVPRQILTPPRGFWYKDPAYAPDASRLAFASCTAGATCTVQVIGLNPELRPEGRPQQIVPPHLGSFGLAWTADGASLLFGGWFDAQFALWRADVKVWKQSERVELAGLGASAPALDRTGTRLAFSRRLRNPDIWRMERGGKASPFLTSSLGNSNPQYSPDGRRIAFQSWREGGYMAVWVANADGSNLTRIAKVGETSGTPRWSPDGRSIAFDAYSGGWGIWVTGSSGGPPRQLTHGPGVNGRPSWSRDGSFIYFGSTRSGRPEVWRMPLQGGAEEQITRNGGYLGFESTDGKTLYYTLSDSGIEGVYAKRLPDGEERQVLKDAVAHRGFAVFPEGIYYLHQGGTKACQVRFYDFVTGQMRDIGEIDGQLALGLAVSPDRKTFLFSRIVDAGADLMLIENFR